MNPQTIHFLNLFLGTGTLVLLGLSVLTLLVLFFRPGNRRNAYLDFINKHYLVLSFFIAVASSLFPLIYSEIVGFVPCVLCWWQRAFMFPTMFMFAVALWDKDRKVVRYVSPLIAIGFLISVYHNFIYYFGNSSGVPCDASGVSCFQALIPEFQGLVQIPTMALTAFISLLTLIAVAHFYGRRNMLESQSGN